MAEGILNQFRNGALNIFFKVPSYDPIAWVNLGIISYYQYGKTDSLRLQSTKSAQNVYTY